MVKTSEVLEASHVYTREQLGEMFSITDATIYTGIFQPAGHESVWLFVTENKTRDRTQYQDLLDGDVLDWDGQTKGRKDHLIIEHKEHGLELLLFYRRKKYEHPGAGFRYEGPFEYVSHEGSGPAHFKLKRASGLAELEVVTTRAEIGANIITFHQTAHLHPERVRNLLSTTRYWVGCLDDPLRDEILLAPSKFAGFKGMTFKRYELAAAGRTRSPGGRFDGHVARRSIEEVVGEKYRKDEELAELLQQTGRSMAGDDVDPFAKVEQNKWRFLMLEPRRRYWGLMCNPEVYRIREAISVLEEDTWVILKGDPQPGDRLAIWKARGKGTHRGIVALGEVVASPEVIPPQPESLPFWVAGLVNEPERRIRFRYVVPPREHCWLEDDESGLLDGLSVANAQGNKLYKITLGQWQDLVAAMGGWPGDDLVVQQAVSGAAQEATERAAARDRGQGFSSSPERNKAIEMHAMAAATVYFEDKGYSVKDTSAHKPYDLVASKDEEFLYVEVKGTTTVGEQVILTKNEVRHAQEHRDQMVLFILHDIVVKDGEDGPVASGGMRRVLWTWDVDEGDLTALSFTYKLPLHPASCTEAS